MKLLSLRLSLLGIVFLLFMAQCGHRGTAFLDESKFKIPAEDKKIHTWWHWLDGAITKDGITKDLEAMKQQGICQATILNVGLFNGKDFGVPHIKFDSVEWYAMFHWALVEADRLGIKIGVHNCDGWSSTGGPWITPEKSMKQYIWTKTIITGGKDVKLNLKMPQAIENFYRDVAVVAVRTDEPANSFHLANPEIKVNDTLDASSLMDGCPISGMKVIKGSRVLVSFSNIFSADKIVLHQFRSFMWRNPDDCVTSYILYASQDNKNYRKVSEFSVKGLNLTTAVAIPQTKARFFRLEISGINNPDPWDPFELTELELLGKSEKPLFTNAFPGFSEKTVSIKPHNADIFYSSDTAHSSGTSSNPSTIVNLSSKMKDDGSLVWTAPEGNWTILRFGYTSTGAHNGPATQEGRGLECDKMDTSAVNLHYRHFPSKLISTAGKFTGNTFKFFLIDSWECAYQNWTANFPAEFRNRRGYDIADYIPVLCGESIGHSELSEAVLFDFRTTIADLIEQNYYKHYSELIHKDKLELHAEVIYGNTNYPPLDILKTTKYVDLPMYEFWTSQDPKTGFIQYSPTALPELNFPAVAAIDYNKPMMASEAYTGFAHYSEAPADLKPFGDRAFCAGINQIILHSYVHQPLDKKPGMTLGQYASHFNRNNLYFQFISEWFNYQSRIEYILQQGVTQPDVMYYLGDQLPQFYEYTASNTLPFGYNLNACNFDVLKNKLAVRNGKLILSGESSYGLLCLPAFPYMNLETMQRLEELINEGAIVYGPKPLMPLSLSDMTTNRARFNELADKIWGPANAKNVIENSYGKGKVYWGMSLAELLKKINLSPDFGTNKPDLGNFLFIHKKIGNTDAYFICNQQNYPLDREGIFNIANKCPQLWNPENGDIKQLAIFRNEKGRIRIPLHFGPHESKIIVFIDRKSENNIETVSLNGKQIFPALNQSDSITRIPEAYFSEKGITVYSSMSGKADFTTAEKKIFSKTIPANKETEITEINGRIDFGASYQASISPVEITSLRSLTEFEDPSVRYFSGNAIYRIHFRANAEYASATENLFLDLGKFESVASVTLNGKSIGTVWNPGTYIPVGGLLKEDNLLEVNVANVYRNRFIGDYLQYGKVQNLWTSSPIQQFLDKDKPLKPSGLMGPIKLILLQPVSL